MPSHRKLGRPTAQRKAMLRGLVTALIENGRIETTEARAKEVKSIAEKLISAAIKESDNYTSKQGKISTAKVDAKGNKVTVSKESKRGNTYEVVEREVKTDMVTVDNPSRLSARRKAMNWLYRVKDEKGNRINLVNKLFDEIAPKYKGVNGGYTRIYRIGPRRGDGAEMVILELV
ncbi:bL17 family ribosomal protein [Acetivibrio saccincola]|jgi:large subunit ribosomal protein L17|uniref:Large ribosomal subunit protein bL17 n=1 Tax=Acetivibrio saccincola TaxID=1677857 RepID=A0A2K9EFG6_9FIRM|nr:L17 family ribosomal protein [Acetivibrio saccincola]AUG58894.1 50S ribosomal protein L17 [Acetivibrio saccincola]NLW26439.1 50S ribosomal protein L17 [Acetivibrio saccincola]PQQ66026.1 50S ribosomal protein L17 [Acetivibrio saccincola]HOA97312.1 L17 family ribosomal protein [Acetivibrio saccincola]HQD29139.1 L17 family ribosomal protein [Acetivibrio saccincola]